MRNIKLLLEYDGTSYVGWQRQANGKSIQGEIEDVLCKILQEKVNVIGAGRTDAGVHARGQVANFRTETSLSIEEIQNGLNGLLPDDIVVHNAEEVPPEFHARYSAKERVYSYLITVKPLALMRHYAWYVRYSLDVDSMNSAAQAIIGTHDFVSFSKADSKVNDYQCTVLCSRWPMIDSTFLYEIRANRFLHGMVRALVGTMVDVGRGYITCDEFVNILQKKDRKEAGMAAPAKGLVLESVVY